MGDRLGSHDLHHLVFMPLWIPFTWVWLCPLTCFNLLEYGKGGRTGVIACAWLHHMRLSHCGVRRLSLLAVKKSCMLWAALWRKARNQEQLLSDSQQDTEVLSLTACKKWMLPIVTWTWKRFLLPSDLEVRLQPWPTPWLPLSDETLKQRAQPIQAWTPDPQTRWYKKCMLL